MLINVNESEM